MTDCLKSSNTTDGMWQHILSCIKYAGIQTERTSEEVMTEMSSVEIQFAKQ